MQSSEPCSRGGSGCRGTRKTPSRSPSVPLEVGTGAIPIAVVPALGVCATGWGLGAGDTAPDPPRGPPKALGWFLTSPLPPHGSGPVFGAVWLQHHVPTAAAAGSHAPAHARPQRSPALSQTTRYGQNQPQGAANAEAPSSAGHAWSRWHIRGMSLDRQGWPVLAAVPPALARWPSHQAGLGGSWLSPSHSPAGWLLLL